MAEPRRDLAAPRPRLDGGRLLVVEARYYREIGAMLFEGASRAIHEAGAVFETVEVPGALEIPIAAAIKIDAAIAEGRPYDGVVALGCVVRGETFHFEIVSMQSAQGLMELGVSKKVPLGNGILTVDHLTQAEERADPARGDKGGDAARAAVALAVLRRGGAK